MFCECAGVIGINNHYNVICNHYNSAKIDAIFTAICD
jgi:hypothetical protein